MFYHDTKQQNKWQIDLINIKKLVIYPFVIKIKKTMKISFRIISRFSKLSKEITAAGTKNWSVDALQGYKVEPKASKHAVIMIHEWWGLNKSICQTADIFSKMGNFKVYVPDLYYNTPARDAEEAEHCMNKLDWPKALADIRKAQEQLLKHSQKVSIMGFCMGGALTFAAVSKFDKWHSAAPFYGIPDLKQFPLKTIKCPVLAHFGEKDEMKGFSDKQSAKKLEQDVKENGVNVTVKIWPNVGHAFCNQNSQNFNAATRDEAFKLTASFFNK